MECLDMSIEAALADREIKLPIVTKLKSAVETLKLLIRLEHELAILAPTDYLATEGALIEISRMTAGWIKYLQNSHKKEP